MIISKNITTNPETNLQTNTTTIDLYVKQEVIIKDGLVHSYNNVNQEYILKDLKQIAKTFENDPNTYLNEFTRNDHHTLLNIILSVGSKWEINEEIYFEFRNMMSPITVPGVKGFYMYEATCGDIRSHYYKENDKYWHEVAIFDCDE